MSLSEAPCVKSSWLRSMFLAAHPDDAIFSAGGFLATRPDMEVVTVFAGFPESDGLTAWDRMCGFKSSREAVVARREEDSKAMNELNLRFRHLNYLDWQYRQGSENLELPISSVGEIYAPIGLKHPDHRLLRNLAISLKKMRPEISCELYDDFPYSLAFSSDALAQKCAMIENESDVSLRPEPFPLDERTMERKLKASLYYQSQLTGLRLLKVASRSDIKKILGSYNKKIAESFNISSPYAEIRWKVGLPASTKNGENS